MFVPELYVGNMFILLGPRIYGKKVHHGVGSALGPGSARLGLEEGGGSLCTGDLCMRDGTEYFCTLATRAFFFLICEIEELSLIPSRENLGLLHILSNP